MPDVTKMMKTERLRGREDAREINDYLHACFWAEEDGRAQFLLDRAHEAFHLLAEKLGYTVTPVTAQAAE